MNTSFSQFLTCLGNACLGHPQLVWCFSVLLENAHRFRLHVFLLFNLNSVLVGRWPARLRTAFLRWLELVVGFLVSQVGWINVVCVKMLRPHLSLKRPLPLLPPDRLFYAVVQYRHLVLFWYCRHHRSSVLLRASNFLQVALLLLLLLKTRAAFVTLAGKCGHTAVYLQEHINGWILSLHLCRNYLGFVLRVSEKLTAVNARDFRGVLVEVYELTNRTVHFGFTCTFLLGRPENLLWHAGLRFYFEVHVVVNRLNYKLEAIIVYF